MFGKDYHVSRESWTEVLHIRCPHCDFDNPDGMKYCGECGKRLVKRTSLSPKEHSRAVVICENLNCSLINHVRTWEARPLTERQRLEYDFQVETGMPPEMALDRMRVLESHLKGKEFAKIAALGAPVKELASYFDHLKAQVRVIEKDPKIKKEAEKRIAECASMALDLANIVTSLI